MKTPKTKIYEYDKCSTCRKALKYLEGKKVPFEKVDITEKPPTKSELAQMVKHLGGNFRKLFNTSGQVYREMKLGEKMASIDEKEAIRLLSSNGRLVKRPFVMVEGGGGLVGFREEEWKSVFGHLSESYSRKQEMGGIPPKDPARF